MIQSTHQDEKEAIMISQYENNLFSLVGNNIIGVEMAQNGDGSVIQAAYIIVQCPDGKHMKIEIKPDGAGLAIGEPINC